MKSHPDAGIQSNRSIHVLLIAWSLAVSALTFAQANNLPFTVRTAHPYLFFTDQNVAQFKDRIAKDKPLNAAWTNLLAAANRAIGRSQPDPANLESLCMAYRMTGDKRYATKVRDILLRECQRPNWGEPDLLARDPSWHAGLGLARVCLSNAVGFDTVYDALTPDQRKTIAKGLVTLGIQPTMDDWELGPNRIHSLDSMGHNWWSACVFSAGVAALAVLDDEPRAAKWLDTINTGSMEWFNYVGNILDTKPQSIGDGGGLYESVNYDSFAMSEYLLFRLAWTNALSMPPADIPVIDKIGDYFIHVSYPNSRRLMSLNFGDGSLAVNGSRPVELLWALGNRNPRYLWYLNQTSNEPFREGFDRTSGLGLLFDPGDAALASAPATPDLPASTLFKEMGWATLRSSWDKDATLLAVKSGMTFNHAHADAGSFILFHKGKYLLINSGNCNYALPEYDAYYRQSMASNVVLFNGQGENPEDTYHGSQFPGSVSNLIDAGDLKYVWADATGPNAHHLIRDFRHFLWIGDVILMFDDLKTYEPGEFQWLLHFDGQPSRVGAGIRISQDNVSVDVRPLFPAELPDATALPHDFPEKMRIVEKVGLKDHDAAAKVTYYALTPPDLTRQTNFITAVLLDNSVQLERLHGENFIGVRVRQRGTTTEIYLNTLAESIRHRSPIIAPNGWETDAYLFAVTHPDGSDATDPDKAARFFVADGSFVRRNGTIVLDSLSKVYATWTYDDGKMDAIIQGQPIINAYVRAVETPAEIRLNGSAVSNAGYDDATRLVKLSLDQTSPR